jgi:hypothetical protein
VDVKPRTREVEESLSSPVAPFPSSYNNLKLIVTLGDGSPRFDVRSIGTNQCHLSATVVSLEIGKFTPTDRKSPVVLQKLQARGVKFSGPDIEGECEELSILAGTGEVLLKGNVQLRTKTSTSWNTLMADKVVYQIGTEGLTQEKTPTKENPNVLYDANPKR